MAVATATPNKIRSEFFFRSVIHQPADAATAQLVDLGQPQGASAKMVSIENLHAVLAQVTFSLAAGTGIVAFSIYAGTSAAGANPTAVVTHAVGTAPDAEGDTLYLEATVEAIHEALPTATHVGVWLDMQHNDDECAVTLFGKPRFAFDGLTADYIAA